MRYLLNFVFVLVTVAAPLESPSILFTRAIEPEPGINEIGFDVLPIPDGAILSGSHARKGAAPDGLLLRVGDQGEVLWRRVYGGTGLDLIFSCLPDGADGFVCVGFKAPGGEPGMKAMDGWILRIDRDGEITWEQTYGGPGEDRLTGIRETAQGWMAVGHRETEGKIQAWVLRTDSKGKEIGSWTYDTALPTKGLDALPLQDGGFVFVGGEGAEREASDGLVVRVDANGKQLWRHAVSGPGFQVGYHLQQFRDNTFLVIGYGATPETQSQDAYVMRLNAEGEILYRTTFGGPTHDRATNALILENDALVVVGQTQRPGAVDEDSGWDMMIYGFSPNGEQMWSTRYGGQGVEFGRAVKGNPENLWILGHTTSLGPDSKVLMIRLDASGLLNITQRRKDAALR